MNTLLDIIHIHELVVQYFEQESEKIQQLYQQIKDIDNVSLETLSEKVKTKLIQQKMSIQTDLHNMEKNQNFNFYMFYSMPLIERYKELIKTPVKLSFMSSHSRLHIQRDSITNEKTKIIHEYYDLLKKYQLNTPSIIPEEYLSELLNVVNSDTICNCKLQNTETCPMCKGDIIKCTGCQNSEFDIDGNLFTCINCGLQLDLINATSCIKDIDRINISSKYTYDRRSHFKECINQFQAKQNQNIPDKVFDDLYHQIKIHNLEDGDDNTPPEIKYQRLNKEHIQIFLKELNHTKYYEDIIYIYHKITNKPPDDISHIEAKLMEDFDILIEKYDEKYKNSPNHKRKNFINIQCILYQLLLRHGYKCKRSDFNILKTIDKKYIHEDIIHELFKDLSWNFQSMV
jgi:hypothetical protein